MSVTLKRPKKNFEKSQLMMQNYSYQFIWNVIDQFKGNAEKFYPAFYKSVSEVISKKFWVFEVAKSCPCSPHWIKSRRCGFYSTSKFYLNRKILYIKYLSGYVFGTLYRRIRTIIPLKVCLVLAKKESRLKFLSHVIRFSQYRYN